MFHVRNTSSNLRLLRPLFGVVRYPYIRDIQIAVENTDSIN